MTKSSKSLQRFIAMALLVIMIFTTSNLASAKTVETTGGAQSSNIYDNNYINSKRWSTVTNSYLTNNNNGSYERVEYTGNKIIIEQYNSDFTLQSSKSIEKELNLFGGYYSGNTYNYLIFGQENPEEDNAKEVIRIVKYTKNWDRISAASLSNCNTIVPFDGGNLRCDEYGNKLIIRTAHKMYASANDGLNHQANMTVLVDTNNMKVVDSMHIIYNSSAGYVSHSFNQFVKVDSDGLIYTADHGDAYPRGVVSFRYKNAINSSSSSIISGYYNVLGKTSTMLEITGTIGANDTGVSVGGFELSSSKILVAGCSTTQANDNRISDSRNIFISTVDKGDSTDTAQVKWITEYSKDGTTSTSNPHLTKINDNKFVLLWQTIENNTMQNGVNYVFLDGTGNVQGDIQTMEGNLSDCQPIVTGDSLVWYVTGKNTSNNSAPVFYTLDLTSDETSEPPADKIDINTATIAELRTLDGVGPAVAQAIVDGRPYSSLDDLISVEGMTDAKLQRIKDQGLAYASVIEEPPAVTPTIDVNTATIAELRTLDGVGPAVAQAIVDGRPYSSLDDLMNVEGMTEAKLQRIKEQGLAYVPQAGVIDMSIQEPGNDHSSYNTVDSFPWIIDATVPTEISVRDTAAAQDEQVSYTIKTMLDSQLEFVTAQVSGDTNNMVAEPRVYSINQMNQRTNAEELSAAYYLATFNAAVNAVQVTFTAEGRAYLQKHEVSHIRVIFYTKLSPDATPNTAIYNGDTSLEFIDKGGNTNTNIVVEEQKPEVHTGKIVIKNIDLRDSQITVSGVEYKIASSVEDAKNGNFIKDRAGNDIKFISDGSGLASYSGLAYGNMGDSYNENTGSTIYWIVQTRSGEGYNLLNNPLAINISITYASGSDSIIDYIGYLEIKCDKGFTLPCT